MAIEIIPTALWHSVTPQEILEVVEYPLVRYEGRSRMFPEATIYRHIGDPSVHIEVLAEALPNGDLAVFHAMVLRANVAEECFAHTAGAVDLRDAVSSQRPYIGPRK